MTDTLSWRGKRSSIARTTGADPAGGCRTAWAEDGAAACPAAAPGWDAPEDGGA
jgi:hypothetical protein